jgi:hypothetical protein
MRGFGVDRFIDILYCWILHEWRGLGLGVRWGVPG